MIKTFQFFFNHEDLKPNYRQLNPYCHVWYMVENGVPKISSIQLPPALLFTFEISRLENLHDSINDAVQNNYENLVKPQNVSTVELAEQFNNGQYE